jgi:RHS repeat-associated protein
MKFKIILIGLLLLPIFAVSNSFAQEMEVIYYHNDTLGSPRAATDETGKKVLWRENYAPYGKKLENQQAESGNHIGYTGKPHERITGFTYLNARYYDPVIGRFMAVDPVDFRQKGEQYFQRYTYADNNPYKYTDPTGEVVKEVATALAIAYVSYRISEAIETVEKGYEESKATEDLADAVNKAAKEKDYEKMFSENRKFNEAAKNDLKNAMDASVAAGGLPGSASGGMPATSLSDLVESEVTEAISNALASIENKKKEVSENTTSTDSTASNNGGGNQSDKGGNVGQEGGSGGAEDH